MVAVVDTGVDYTHPELLGRVVLGPDFVGGDDDPMDDHGHGTHVSGIIASAVDNAVGSAGISPTSRVLAIKALDGDGGGSLWNVVQGIYAAADNPEVVAINLSLGTPIGTGTMMDAIRYAAETKGKVVVAAAGNGKTDKTYYPAVWSHWIQGVIGVAANDQNQCRAAFSNYGENATIAAPGVSIMSTLPNGGYGSWSGTSMAAPFVAGAVARLAAQDSQLSNTQIQTRLLANGTPLAVDGTCWPTAGAPFLHLDLAFALGESGGNVAETKTVNLVNGADDASESLSTLKPDGGKAKVYVGKNTLNGYRFASVPIPQGALVTEARLLVYAVGNYSASVSLRYRLEAADDSAVFTGASGELSSRPKTSGQVLDNPASWSRDFNPSPDLRAILQEVVSRVGWQEGNAITVFVEDNRSKGRRLAAQQEHDPAVAATLLVKFMASP